MARVCDVTGKKTTTGNNVSHAKNRTRRKFLPNLQNRKIWVESENRWISMKISGAALRTVRFFESSMSFMWYFSECMITWHNFLLNDLNN